MTPQKALAILDGRITRREFSKDPLNEKRTLAKNKPPLKEFEIIEEPPVEIEKNHDFLKVLVFVLIMGGLIIIHLWRIDDVSESSYEKGYNDGVASNLMLTQKEIQLDNQLKEYLENSKESVVQLAQQVSLAKHNLAAMASQNQKLSMRETQVPALITAKELPLEEKISEFQKNIDTLSARLASAQQDNGDKEEQLNGLQKLIAQMARKRDEERQTIADMEGQLAAAQKDLKNKVQELKVLHQEMASNNV